MFVGISGLWLGSSALVGGSGGFRGGGCGCCACSWVVDRSAWLFGVFFFFLACCGMVVVAVVVGVGIVLARGWSIGVLGDLVFIFYFLFYLLWIGGGGGCGYD